MGVGVDKLDVIALEPPPLTPPRILVARLRRDGEGNPVEIVSQNVVN